MSIVVFLLIMALLAVVIALISAPIRARSGQEREGEGSATAAPGAGSAPELDDLRTEREAKYQEIRDAELDYRTGKLSSEDYAAIDGALRAEAIEILDRLQELEAAASGTAPPGAAERGTTPRDA